MCSISNQFVTINWPASNIKQHFTINTYRIQGDYITKLSGYTLWHINTLHLTYIICSWMEEDWFNSFLHVLIQIKNLNGYWLELTSNLVSRTDAGVDNTPLIPSSGIFQSFTYMQLVMWSWQNGWYNTHSTILGSSTYQVIIKRWKIKISYKPL